LLISKMSNLNKLTRLQAFCIIGVQIYNPFLLLQRKFLKIIEQSR